MHKWSKSRRVVSGGSQPKGSKSERKASPPPLPVPDEKEETSSNPDSLSSIELKIEGSDDDDSGCSLEEFAWIPPNLKPELVKAYFSQIPKHKIPYVNSVGEKYRIRQMLYQLPPQDTEAKYCSGLSGEEERELKMFAENRRQEALGRGSVKQLPSSLEYPFSCGNCKESIGKTELGIFAIRAGLHTCWHPACFVCCVCKELLVDLVYFYKDDKLYCGRHHAESLKPRCSACDELIFADECTEAERRAWHIKHFCCCECDAYLGGKRYIMEDGRPHCIDCYDQLFGNNCDTCHRLISVDEGEMSHESCHWHATKSCFRCQYCHFSLLGRPFLPRKDKIFCSLICYGREQRRGSSKSCASPKPSLVPSFEFNFDSEMSLELKCLSESSRENGRSFVSDVTCDTLSLSRQTKPPSEKEDFEIKRSPKSVFYKQRGKTNIPVKPRPIRRVKSSPERQRPPIKLLSRSQAVNTDLTFLPRTFSSQMISKGVQVNVPEALVAPETPLVLMPIREDDLDPQTEVNTKLADRRSGDIELILKTVASEVTNSPDKGQGVAQAPSSLIPRSKSSSSIINKIISKEELKKLHELLQLLSSKQLTLVPSNDPQQLALVSRNSPKQVAEDRTRQDRHKLLSKSSQLPRKTYTQCDDNSNSGTDNYDWFIPGSKGSNSVFTESLNSINLSRTFAQKLSKSCPPPSSGDGCSTCSSSSCDEEEFDAPLKRPFPPIIDTHKLPPPEIYTHSLPRNTNYPSKVGSKRFRFFRDRQSNCIVS